MDVTGFPDVFLFRAGEHKLPPIHFNASMYNGERGLKATLQVRSRVKLGMKEKEGKSVWKRSRVKLSLKDTRDWLPTTATNSDATTLQFVKDHAALQFGDAKGNKYGGKKRDEL